MSDNELRRICWKIVEFSKEFKKYHMVSPELYPLEELTDELEDELIRLLNVESEECPKGTHESLDEALGCWKCQNASLRVRRAKNE